MRWDGMVDHSGEGGGKVVRGCGLLGGIAGYMVEHVWCVGWWVCCRGSGWLGG